jgi:NADPH:quinone reductase-like Zn-dependent oxidoreductase
MSWSRSQGRSWTQGRVRSFEDHIAADLEQVIRLLDTGSVSPHIGAELSLAEAASAHRMLEDATVPAKLCFSPE